MSIIRHPHKISPDSAINFERYMIFDVFALKIMMIPWKWRSVSKRWPRTTRLVLLQCMRRSIGAWLMTTTTRLLNINLSVLSLVFKAGHSLVSSLAVTFLNTRNSLASAAVIKDELFVQLGGQHTLGGHLRRQIGWTLSAYEISWGKTRNGLFIYMPHLHT